MSREAVEQFREELNRNEALQQELLKALSRGPEAVVELGQSRGFGLRRMNLRTSCWMQKGAH
jgi:hypothetical protein